MKFKKSITITVGCMAAEFLLSYLPAVILTSLLFTTENGSEWYWNIVTLPYFILIFEGILWIISLVAKLFIKEEVVLEKERMIIRGKEKEIAVAYEDIAGINYDFGVSYSKYNRSPSELILFDRNDRQIAFLKHPSIPMLLVLKKRCKGIKWNYYNNKRFLYVFILVNAIAIPALLLLKFFI